MYIYICICIYTYMYIYMYVYMYNSWKSGMKLGKHNRTVFQEILFSAFLSTFWGGSTHTHTRGSPKPLVSKL